MAAGSSRLARCRANTCWDQASRRRQLAAGRPIEERTMTRPISRRRFIRISAAAAGLAVVPVLPMQIHHEDRSEAQRLISAACTEARRLERLFSLYLEDSALVELNRSGILV